MNGKATKKDYIYYHLISGYPASKIKDFKEIKCSSSYISKVIKQFISHRYIKEIYEKNERGQKRPTKPKLYGRGRKQYPAKLTNLTSGSLMVPSKKPEIKPTEQPRLNLICVYYKVLEKPSQIVRGHSFMVNNTKYIDTKKYFEFGRVNFRLINEKALRIFMPSTYVDANNLRDTKLLLYGLAKDCSNWYQKRFGVKLGDPEIRQDYEIAIAENDPFLSELSQKYGMIKLVDENNDVIMWWDKSKGYLEGETTKERIAENKVLGPIKIGNIEDRVYHMQQQIEALNMTFEGLEGKIGSLAMSMDKLQSSIDKVNEFFDRPPGPDERREIT